MPSLHSLLRRPVGNAEANRERGWHSRGVRERGSVDRQDRPRAQVGYDGSANGPVAARKVYTSRGRKQCSCARRRYREWGGEDRRRVVIIDLDRDRPF